MLAIWKWKKQANGSSIGLVTIMERKTETVNLFKIRCMQLLHDDIVADIFGFLFNAASAFQSHARPGCK